MRLTTYWNLLQRSLILESFSDYLHTFYMCRDGCNLRTFVQGPGLDKIHRATGFTAALTLLL